LAQGSTKDEEKSRRLRERVGLGLPVRVNGRESLDHEWMEVSRLLDVTPFGARLRLKRPTEPGRLLKLTLPMPRPLRCFDHVEDQYRVWSLVRNVRLLDPGAEKGALVEIGVAFVGKRPPRSFADDPARRYEIAKSSTEAGVWTVQEESGESLSEVSITDKRKETRHIIPIEVLVEVFAKDGGFAESEKTVTENISPQGAAVFTTLDLLPGRFVKLSSEQYRAAVLAVVRNRHTGADGIGRLHLEFVGSEWPL
jgi:PilZ domain